MLFAHFINGDELLLYITALKKQFFTDRFIAETGRNKNSINAELFQFTKEHLNFNQIGIFENGGVCTNAKSLFFGFFDCSHCRFKCALTLQNPVMGIFQAIHMYIKSEIWMWCHYVKRLFKQNAVSTEVYMLATLQYCGDELMNLRIQERLSP